MTKMSTGDDKNTHKDQQTAEASPAFSCWDDRGEADPRDFPPDGYKYDCILSLYGDRFYDGVGREVEVWGGVLLPRNVCKDNSFYFFRPANVVDAESPRFVDELVVTDGDRVLCENCHLEAFCEQDPCTHYYTTTDYGVCDSCGVVSKRMYERPRTGFQPKGRNDEDSC